MCSDCDESKEGSMIPSDQDGVLHERFEIYDAVTIGLRWAANVVNTTSGALHALANCAGMHANYRRQRQEFAEAAGYEIESLTTLPLPSEDDR